MDKLVFFNLNYSIFDYFPVNEITLFTVCKFGMYGTSYLLVVVKHNTFK
jgi:hypothetical protein